MGKLVEVPEQSEQARVRRDQPGRRPRRIDEHLVSLLTPSSFAAEQYRVLRHLIEQMHRDAGLRVLAVTSPAVADGKTTTSINLAGCLAQAPDARVLLVDADVRRGALADHLGLGDPDAAGLTDSILDSGIVLADVTRHLSAFNLWVLTAGRSPSAPYEVLQSPRLGELLAQARRQYDYVVLDTPPLIPVPDSRVIANWVDGFLMVVAAHKTPRRLVEEALDAMDPAKTLGLVFNGDDRPLSGYYSSYNYHQPYGSERSRDGNPAGRWRSTVRKVGDLVRRVS
jgi:capsular exopolysaccharide synthesis family protein